MGFRVRCPKKGCGKDIEPLLDPNTNKVFCECSDNFEITTITDFAKRQMVSLGQVLNKKKSVGGFAVKCPACQRQGTPQLNKTSGSLSCTFCDSELTHLSVSFVRMLKDQLSQK